MLITQEDFSIELLSEEKTAILTGTMRLSSPTAYDEFFSEIVKMMSEGGSITVDISQLEFLNSSGLTSLGRVFIQAKNLNMTGKIIAKKDVPWHQRSIVSIAKLWPKALVVMK